MNMYFAITSPFLYLTDLLQLALGHHMLTLVLNKHSSGQ